MIVGVHSDFYIEETLKTTPRQKHEERMQNLRNVDYVDEVFRFNDSDGTSCVLLQITQVCYPDAEIFFVTSDKGSTMIPETKVKGVKFLNVR